VSRRSNGANRCARCRMHASLCVCSLIPSPRLETRTRLVLIIHRAEDRKSTNTGRLAAECLANSEVWVRGHHAHPSEPLTWERGWQPILLFPHEGARPLAEVAANSAGPVALVVPDGTWRQASKVRRRVPGVSELPCAWLPAAAPSMYRLRAESHEAGLATLEAIARAMGILEGMHVQRELERVFRALVERTLWARGAVATGDVSSGIPEGAARHDPRSGLARGRPSTTTP
jgi:DTW domain-containing protein YfiP